MKNYENKEVQNKLACLMAEGRKPAVDKKTQMLVPCSELTCAECAIYKLDVRDCLINLNEWLNKEHESDEMMFARSLNKGDIAEFSPDGEHWYLRYFKEICGLNGTYIAYTDAGTGSYSWNHIRKPQFVKTNKG